jgi:hypothetical protein
VQAWREQQRKLKQQEAEEAADEAAAAAAAVAAAAAASAPALADAPADAAAGRQPGGRSAPTARDGPASNAPKTSVVTRAAKVKFGRSGRRPAPPLLPCAAPTMRVSAAACLYPGRAMLPSARAAPASRCPRWLTPRRALQACMPGASLPTR